MGADEALNCGPPQLAAGWQGATAGRAASWGTTHDVFKVGINVGINKGGGRG
jgi:hypothetical protein